MSAFYSLTHFLFLSSRRRTNEKIIYIVRVYLERVYAKKNVNPIGAAERREKRGRKCKIKNHTTFISFKDNFVIKANQFVPSVASQPGHPCIETPINPLALAVPRLLTTQPFLFLPSFLFYYFVNSTLHEIKMEVEWTGFTSLSQFVDENRRPGLAQSLREHFRRGQLWHHIIFMMLHCPPSRLSLAMYRFNQHKSVAKMSTNPRLHSPRRHSGDFKPILLHNQSALRLIRTSDAFMALILFNNINFYVKIVTYTLLSGMQT